jgi:hypothetical protein
VPWIAHWPAAIAKGGESTQLCMTMDRSTTMPDAAGAKTFATAIRRWSGLLAKRITCSTPHTLLQQHLRLPRQICSDPEHVIPVLLPCFLEPSIAIAMATPQQ